MSELRQDVVTGDWVVVATGRARRPNEFVRRRTPERVQPRAGCPFERLLPPAIIIYDRAGERFRLTKKERRHLERQWWLQVVPNKFPAFLPGLCPVPEARGPYRWQQGVGFHEVVVTRDHRRAIAAMEPREVEIVLRAYRQRYLALKDEDCVQYISIFHNHGREAGATISHPHSQIIAIPVIPPDIGRSLRGSTEYFRRHRRCVHCVMLEFERRDGRRIVYENRDFMVFCPFVSRQAFEIRIFPKRHEPEFERLDDGKIVTAADALRTALAKIERGLRSPAYNFFIHTAPTADGPRLPLYHWHIEVIPKTAVWAGFEIGTGIEISTISPEAAAKFLRKLRI
ncbi:MAG: hypothetical protein A3B37_02950 [Candidatus Sungbacteria bacterium RIFCSPLOWO2_01_FULL_59_16]|uniref:Galactose-1-phosphate uridyl transferase N-terminal domain-containing protein n=1 Tax=Candidatus Sungbacteria bacterium RIFCSPLOWO2_01_FULL_59_16 TaxID=1802280 RepID=A0A1G2LBH9_9BACT|nr:MAG: hypothetical protein A3B37_02950 [Candidatus Sungbacteria bacterium RIFCSPLOWO2_01_FULL_59_16]